MIICVGDLPKNKRKEGMKMWGEGGFGGEGYHDGLYGWSTNVRNPKGLVI